MKWILGALLLFSTSYAQSYNLNIFGDIGTRLPLNHIKHTLEQARQGDTVVINIDTYGGETDTANYIMRLIQESKANTICSAHGNVMSAGLMIFLACKQKVVRTSRGQFLLHRIYMELRGTKIYQVPFSDLSYKLFTPLLRKYGSSLFTQNELGLFRNGLDVFLSNKIMERRLRLGYPVETLNGQPGLYSCGPKHFCPFIVPAP